MLVRAERWLLTVTAKAKILARYRPLALPFTARKTILQVVDSRNGRDGQI
jgi:hypothetical protein